MTALGIIGIILAFAVGTDYYSRTHVKTTLRTAKS